MTKSIPTSGIRDNHTRGIVADFLKSRIKESSHLSIVSAFFAIYAYEALKDHLNRIEHMDFLFGALLKKVIGSIASTFRKRMASALVTNRNAVIPDRHNQADESTDFELITWLVIEDNQCERLI